VIAHRHGTTVAALKEANGLSGDRILVGQKLVIPGAKPTLPDNAMQPPVTVPDGPASSEPEEVSTVTPGGGSRTGTTLGPGLMEAPRQPGAGTADVPYRIHVVEENEDLFAVAMMWGVSVTRIKELNGMTDSTVRVGQSLKIPTSE
jgi:N-acetylmuramoyl-L-alanine amidase